MLHRDPAVDADVLTALLAGWLQQVLRVDAVDLGHLAEGAAWARSFSDVASTELVTSTARKVTPILQNLPDTHRARDELVADWRIF